MTVPDALEAHLDRISHLLTETFHPEEPRALEETGLSEELVESLVCKQLAVLGSASGRHLAEQISLPFGLLEPRLQRLRARQLLTHIGPAALNDFLYVLTDKGREYSQLLHGVCAYYGPAPVPLNDYIASVQAQTITAEACKQDRLEEAFRDISVNLSLFKRLGPAINSGAGLFLYC